MIKANYLQYGITDLADVFQLTFEEQAGSLLRCSIVGKDSNTERKEGELGVSTLNKNILLLLLHHDYESVDNIHAHFFRTSISFRSDAELLQSVMVWVLGRSEVRWIIF